MGKKKKNKVFRVRDTSDALLEYKMRTLNCSLVRGKVRSDEITFDLSRHFDDYKRLAEKRVWVENTLVGKGFQVVVDESATVRHVKVEAERASGVPWRRQVLALHGHQVLDDDAQMLSTLPPPWRVSLMAPLSFDYVQLTDATDNTVFVLEVSGGSELVEHLLSRLPSNGYERRVGPPLRRVLLFRGKPLEPHRTLAYYHITKGDHLRLNRYKEEGYPREVFIETGGKKERGVRVGPFLCGPLTSVRELKVRFINATAAPGGRYRLLSGQHELRDEQAVCELGLQTPAVLVADMPRDPLRDMRPPKRPQHKTDPTPNDTRNKN